MYERRPTLHLAIAAVIITAGIANRSWLAGHPSGLWFVALAIPILAVHEWEEFGFPGGLRQWYNIAVCGSNDADYLWPGAHHVHRGLLPVRAAERRE